MARTRPFSNILSWKCVSLCATAACKFSTSQLSKVVQCWCVLYIFVLRAAAACKIYLLLWPHGSPPAALASLLLLFDPPDPQIIGKNRAFHNFPNISRTCIFFLLTLSLSLFLLSSTPLFPLTLLCFSSLHIVGSLTFKLPLVTA